MLTFVGFVAVIVFRAVSAHCVACCRSSFLAIIRSDLELSACSLASFLRAGVSKGALTLLLMCLLTDLDVSLWST